MSHPNGPIHTKHPLCPQDPARQGLCYEVGSQPGRGRLEHSYINEDALCTVELLKLTWSYTSEGWQEVIMYLWKCRFNDNSNTSVFYERCDKRSQLDLSSLSLVRNVNSFVCFDSCFDDTGAALQSVVPNSYTWLCNALKCLPQKLYSGSKSKSTFLIHISYYDTEKHRHVNAQDY